MAEILPQDGTAGTLIGRVQRPAGPSVVAVRAEGVFDITPPAPTVADLCNAADPVALARSRGERIGSLDMDAVNRERMRLRLLFDSGSANVNSVWRSPR